MQWLELLNPSLDLNGIFKCFLLDSYAFLVLSLTFCHSEFTVVLLRNNRTRYLHVITYIVFSYCSNHFQIETLMHYISIFYTMELPLILPHPFLSQNYFYSYLLLPEAFSLARYSFNTSNLHFYSFLNPVVMFTFD